MAHTINVDIVSAEGEIYSGVAAMVFVPAAQGQLNPKNMEKFLNTGFPRT